MSQSLASSAVPAAREPPIVTASMPAGAPRAAHRSARGRGRSLTRSAGRSARAEKVPERAGALDRRVHVLGEQVARRDHGLRFAADARQVVVAPSVPLLDGG